jgi:hypothetical protein
MPREGWSLLTVETEVNGDSKSTNERGPSLVSSLGMSCRYNSFCFCSALVALVCPEQNIFLLHTLFQFLCANRPASRADSGAGSPGS